MSAFAVAGRAIGGGARCFVIAEAGVNHNGELALAHRLVDAAAEAAADAVKFQTFDPDALAAPEAPKAAYQARHTGADESQRDMLRRLTLSPEAHVALQRHAVERGLIFLSTPFEERSADFLDGLGVPAFKVSSGEVTNHPFLRYLANKGRPLLVSTGMSDADEVAAAASVLSGSAFALLHCTSSYPAPIEAVNLRAMAALRVHGVPVGYSDHTLGDTIPIAAVTLGAEILEKHLTLDRALPGPDHEASMEPAPFRDLVAAVRRVELALGDGRKVVQPCERETQRVARKSLFTAASLPAGHIVRPHDLVARRPGTGLAPSLLETIVGRRLRAALAEGALLREADLE